jgi:hypothetical protein
MQQLMRPCMDRTATACCMSVLAGCSAAAPGGNVLCCLLENVYLPLAAVHLRPLHGSTG